MKYFALLLLLFSGSLFSLPKIKALPSYFSANPVFHSETSFQQVYIQNKCFYFLEDYGNLKLKESNSNLLQPHFGKPCFQIFTFSHEKLERHFYFIENPKQELTDGFYQVEFEILKKIQKKSFNLYQIQLLKKQKTQLDLHSVKNKILTDLDKNHSFFKFPSLKIFQKTYSKTKPLTLKPDFFRKDFILTPYKNKLELVGGNGENFVFRWLLGIADNESYEGTTTRGYFCYLDYHLSLGIQGIFIVIADFSIYTR